MTPVEYTDAMKHLDDAEYHLRLAKEAMRRHPVGVAAALHAGVAEAGVRISKLKLTAHWLEGTA